MRMLIKSAAGSADSRRAMRSRRSGRPVNAATSRAIPTTLRQSPRFGVIATSSTVSSIPRTAATRAPIGAASGRMRMPDASAPIPNSASAAEHARRRDAAHVGGLDTATIRQSRACRRERDAAADAQVRRATHHGDHAVCGANAADGQTLRVGVRRHGDQLGTHDGSKVATDLVDRFDFEPRHGEALSEGHRLEVEIDELEQPGPRDAHGGR